MRIVQRSEWCPVCGRQSLFAKRGLTVWFHALMSAFTLGTWALFVWLPLGLLQRARRPRCQTCGWMLGTPGAGPPKRP